MVKEINDSRESILESGQEVAGWIVWWEVGEALVERKRLKELYADNGLDTSLVPDEPSPKVALTDAMRALLRDSRPSERGYNLMLRLIHRGSWGIVEEKVDTKEEKLNYQHEKSVTLMEKRLNFSPNFDNGSPISQANIEEYYQRYLSNLFSKGVIDVLLRTLRASSALTMRGRGGIYFMPQSCVSVVDALREIVPQCGPESITRFYDYPVVATSKVKEDLIQSLIQQIAAEGNRLIERCEVLSGSERRRGTKYTGAVDKILQEFTGMSGDIRLYKTEMDVASEIVDKQLGEVEQAVKNLMNIRDRGEVGSVK